jgi:hypothetical protein
MNKRCEGEKKSVQRVKSKKEVAEGEAEAVWVTELEEDKKHREADEDVLEKAREEALWARELDWMATECRRLDAGMPLRWVMNLYGLEEDDPRGI